MTHSYFVWSKADAYNAVNSLADDGYFAKFQLHANGIAYKITYSDTEKGLDTQ